MILDTAVGMFPQKTGPLLQLLTALLSNKSTVKKVHGTNTQAHISSNLGSSIQLFFSSCVRGSTGVQLFG